MKKIIKSRILVKLLYGVIMFYFIIYRTMMEITENSPEAGAGAGFFTGVVFTVIWILGIQGAGCVYDVLKEFVLWIKNKRDKRNSEAGDGYGCIEQ